MHTHGEYTSIPRIILNHNIIQDMVKTKQTTWMLGPVTHPVSAAAKWPDITSAYVDTIEESLRDFDDEVTSISSKQRAAAYHNLATSYKAALATIWAKASGADITVILDAVTDKELQELQRMTKLLKPPTECSKVVEEQHTVPELRTS